VCPDNAVIKLGPGKRFEFNFDYCKGCGICVSECPCGAIKMVPEGVLTTRLSFVGHSAR
jgi:Pyruvate/2-oxoacid:ferredoxin oxidoreductase delta subunit